LRDRAPPWARARRNGSPPRPAAARPAPPFRPTQPGPWPLAPTDTPPLPPPSLPQENGILYGAAGAAGVAGLVVIVAVERTLAAHDLAALVLGLSNTFALSVGLLLMGYGLVEIPREMWKSRPEQLLKWCAHR
jgi:hypothetical protein